MSVPQSVRIIETISKETLFECSVENMERAYQYASELEKLGLSIVIESPHIHHTLAQSLGVGSEEMKAYAEGLEHEIAEHEDGPDCCTTSST